MFTFTEGPAHCNKEEPRASLGRHDSVSGIACRAGVRPGRVRRPVIDRTRFAERFGDLSHELGSRRRSRRARHLARAARPLGRGVDGDLALGGGIDISGVLSRGLEDSDIDIL